MRKLKQSKTVGQKGYVPKNTLYKQKVLLKKCHLKMHTGKNPQIKNTKLLKAMVVAEALLEMQFNKKRKNGKTTWSENAKC
jgi:hypothetical protein